MARRLLWVWLGALLTGGAFGQELESYLKTRAAHKIKGATPIAGLELAVGTRVLEVEGVVVGSVAVGEARSILRRLSQGELLHLATLLKQEC